MASGLDEQILAHIWGLCDVTNQGQLNSEQFALAMYLIHRKVTGVDPPQTLSPEMVPPSMRTSSAGTFVAAGEATSSLPRRISMDSDSSDESKARRDQPPRKIATFGNKVYEFISYVYRFVQTKYQGNEEDSDEIGMERATPLISGEGLLDQRTSMIGTATDSDDEEVPGKKEDTDQMARIATAGEKVHDHIPDLTLCALDYPMASSSPSPLASSVEKTNGAKLRRLLIDGGTMVLRNIFDGYHPPANLQANLNANYGTLKNLLRRRVLHLRQWDLLFPPGKATADSNTFDITLLFVLLTSICGLSPPPTGWYTKPSAIDTSVEANLARIKFFRNELYGRITTTGMDTHTFSALWREIGAALVALGLPQADIDRLKAERCGEEDFLDVLFEWADSEEDIKSQLRDIRQYQAKSGQSFFEIATFGEKVNDDIPDLTSCTLDYGDGSPCKKTNAKLSRLLIDGGTMVLRKIFDRYHPPANLQANLNANYDTLNNLLRRRVLRQPQWYLLFPPGGATPKSNTFDMTLLFLLLKSICGLSPPPSGWHSKPSASDNSVEANLARITFFRNELYGHVTTTSMDTPTFSALWQEISAVLVALGLPQAEIDRLKAEHCGEEDFLGVLFEWADSEEDIKSQLKDIRQYQAKTGQTVVEGKIEDTDQMTRIPTFGKKVFYSIPDESKAWLKFRRPTAKATISSSRHPIGTLGKEVNVGIRASSSAENKDEQEDDLCDLQTDFVQAKHQT
ncbi:PREDICTED: uncharacterized protein LOC107350903 isoform X6 [Acropora digitifera]|uniref:uncharacterized protein LOC107350903 isoform X6 n=1 Tax=Acropora digitifera TaxID=70779 RepID=UPI00077A62CB|nr:PREDICTED: uncharacterized protein LOC107350903 isoform X6 [Acropora digitifera]